MISSSTHNDLDTIYRIQQEVKALLAQERHILSRFVDQRDGVIKRAADDAGTEKYAENHATCTGFCLFYLAASGFSNHPGTPLASDFLSSNGIAHALRSLGRAIISGHSGGVGDGLFGDLSRTDTAPLPNQYNSSIQVAGYLRVASGLASDLDPSLVSTFSRVVSYLTDIIVSNGGYVTRLGGPIAPSSYLTYWTAALIAEFVKYPLGIDPSEVSLACQALRAIARWSEQELATGIAYHHSGLTSRFDIIELAYATLISLEFGNSPETLELARHAVSILFKEYFSDGCFSRSAPVLADRHNFSLQVPTVEILALLITVKPDIFLEFWEPLFHTYEWVQRHKVDGEGWYPESEGRHGKPTAFMTTSVLTFLQGFASLLDDVLSMKASEELGVPSFSPKTHLDSIHYPGDLHQLLQSHVIRPLNEETNADLACYSMILYGPPGTAKTTVARKLAQDLGWPLLVIGQSDFLRRGIDHIDAEADRIFKLASYLKRVVVLFDEVEEIVADRSNSDKLSRLLTTSMLPRIHHLRDRKRVVFIFATNYVESIDRAAARLGRFDIIRCVMPPTEDERRSIIERELSQRGASKSVKEAFRRARVVEETEYFSYGELAALVQSVMRVVRLEAKPVRTELIITMLKAAQRRIDPDDLQKYEERRVRFDRP